MTRSITYRRGSASVTLQATIGRTDFASDQIEPVIETWQSRDFLVRTPDLVFDGIATLPKRGDQIDETDGSVTHTYEVMAPGGQTPWRYADDFRRELRVHTKHVKTT